MGTTVEIRGISKSYVRNTRVLNPVDLTVQSGELFFLLGSSGCGKSTLLRIIAGLLKPDEGSILFDGTDVTNLPPEKRRAAMVFQNYALWPHMSVFESSSGLRLRALLRCTPRFFFSMNLFRTSTPVFAIPCVWRSAASARSAE